MTEDKEYRVTIRQKVVIYREVNCIVQADNEDQAEYQAKHFGGDPEQVDYDEEPDQYLGSEVLGVELIGEDKEDEDCE